jgi:hypothetical protein
MSHVDQAAAALHGVRRVARVPLVGDLVVEFTEEQRPVASFLLVGQGRTPS